MRDYPGLAALAPGRGPRAAATEAPPGFDSLEDAADALIPYKYLLAMRPEDVDISDIDPEAIDDWTEEQWLRAEHSGLADRLLRRDDGGAVSERGTDDAALGGAESAGAEAP